jgi:hypothetical protein
VLDTKAQGSKSFTYDYVADETIPQVRFTGFAKFEVSLEI